MKGYIHIYSRTQNKGFCYSKISQIILISCTRVSRKIIKLPQCDTSTSFNVVVLCKQVFLVKKTEIKLNLDLKLCYFDHQQISREYFEIRFHESYTTFRFSKDLKIAMK